MSQLKRVMAMESSPWTRARFSFPLQSNPSALGASEPVGRAPRAPNGTGSFGDQHIASPAHLVDRIRGPVDRAVPNVVSPTPRRADMALRENQSAYQP